MCNIISDSDITAVAWEFSGGNLSISANPHYEGGTPADPNLTIKNATDSDGGHYKCFASNVNGSAESNIVTINILGRLNVVIIGNKTLSKSFLFEHVDGR